MADMMVETFEVAEVTPEGLEDISSPEAVKIITDLNLSGQFGLLSEKDGKTERCPYREMTDIEHRVYEVLLSAKVKIEAYDVAPIPLRVLQVAAHAKKFFPRIDVLYEPTDSDPILVGRSTTQEWGGKSYLLARWGPHLQPFEKLAVLARTRLVAKWKSKGARHLGEVQSFMTNLESHASAYMNGESVCVPF